MVWTARGQAGVGNNAGPTEITHGIPIAAGDLVIATFHTNVEGDTLAALQGTGAPWTNIVNNQAATNETQTHSVWFKIANATEPATYQFTNNNPTDRWGILIHAAFGGGAAELDFVPTFQDRSGSTNIINVADSVDTLSPDALAYALVMQDSEDNYTLVDSPYGNLATNTITVGQCTGAAWQEVATPGPTGQARFTASGSDRWYGWHIIFKPGGAAGPTVGNVGPAAATTNTLLAGSTYDVTNGAGGTTWAAVYPTGSTPTHAEIKAGTGAVGSTANNPIVDATITDGQNTVDTAVTGLNSDTDYDLWIAIEDSGAVEGTPASGAFKTANANPFITEQLNFVTVNASQATHRMTASDADDPDVEYLVAYYPNGTGGAVTDTQLEDDCRNAPAGGGVPAPNPRGCLWARSITQAQGTQYLDTSVGLSSLQSYDVESGVADLSNPTVRGTSQNITMGFKTCTQALPWKNADGSDIGVLTGIAWRWKDTALGAYTDNGTLDIDATGNWGVSPNIEGSTLADGQIGYFEAELGVRIQTYRYVVSSSPGSVN